MSLIADFVQFFGFENVRDFTESARRHRYHLYAFPFQHLGYRRAALSAGHRLLADFIATEYSATPILRCNDQTYPIAIWPANPFPTQLDALGRQLSLDLTWRASPAARAHVFYWLQRSIIESENRPTFVLKRLSTSPFSLECGVADFFTALRTAQALEWELHQAVGWAIESGTHDHEAIRRRLRLRHKLLGRINQPWLVGDGRAAAIGLSVLLAYREGKETKVFLRRRGPKSIAYNRGKWHVFPSGMFQAAYADYETEFSILHAVLWEYLEELFDIPDPPDRREDPRWFYSRQPITELLSMLDAGTAQIHVTGIAVNLCSMRPELLLTLLVKDESWFNRHATSREGAQPFRFSSELAASGDAKPDKPPLMRPRLPSSPDRLFAECHLAPAEVVPSGAAALYLGIGALNAVGGI